MSLGLLLPFTSNKNVLFMGATGEFFFFSEAVLIYLRLVVLQHLHFDKWYLYDVSELAMSSSVRYQVISDGNPPTVLGLQHGWFILKEVDCHKVDSASFQKKIMACPFFGREKSLYFKLEKHFLLSSEVKSHTSNVSSVCPPGFFGQKTAGFQYTSCKCHFDFWFSTHKNQQS